MLTKKLRSFAYAAKGIRIAIQEERNFQIEVVLAIATVLLGWGLDISILEWILIVFAIGVVLSAELFNTALEELCDMLRQTHDPHVAKIKDLSAAAVSLSALTAFLIGLAVFLPHLL